MNLNIPFKSRRHNVYRYALIGILLLGVTIRLIGLNKGIWLDEYASIQIISAKNFYQALQPHDYPPLYFALLKIWSTISVQESFLRLMSVILGTGNMIIVILWLKSYSKLASLIAGLMCAALPVLLRYSHEIQTYPLLILGTAISFFFASRIVKQTGSLPDYLGLVIGLTTVVTTHLIGSMLLLSIFLFIFLSSLPNYKQVLNTRLFVSLATPAIVFVGVYVVFLGIPEKSSWWMPVPTFDLAWTITKDLSGWNALGWLVGNTWRYAPSIAPFIKPMIGILLAISAASALFLGDWRLGFPFLAAAAGYWMEILAYSYLSTPVFWDKTLLPSLIPLVGFVALQVATIRQRYLKWFSIICLILLCLYFAGYWALDRAKRPYEEWRQTAESLQAQIRPHDVVLFYPHYVYGPFNYYLPDLSSEQVVTIRAEANREMIEALRPSIHQQAPPHSDMNTLPATFLIIRNDLVVSQNIDTYNYLQQYLTSELGAAVFSQKLGILSLTKYVGQSPAKPEEP